MPEPKIISILEKPTYDLARWEISVVYIDDKIVFCQSKEVFKFDKCKGTIMPRSRILRYGELESRSVKNVISATIDAGFTGKLVWKIELTDYGFGKLHYLKFHYGNDGAAYTFQSEIKDSVQIDLNPFPNNYYHGTNQTDLEPDVVFSGEKKLQRKDVVMDISNPSNYIPNVFPFKGSPKN